MREDYKFAKEFLAAVDGREGLHPFALEKGCQALAGSRRVTISEVRYLLKLENSPGRLKDFVLGYDYIQHLATSEEGEISFRSKYKSKWSRTWRKCVYFLLYVALALFAFSPLIAASPLQLSPRTVAVALALSLPIPGMCSVKSLTALLKLASAERLVELQRVRAIEADIDTNGNQVFRPIRTPAGQD